MNDEIPLYIHVPFCESKCHYCSFYSVIFNEEKEKIWLNDIEQKAKFFNNLLGRKKLKTLYIGGGTPSILKIHTFEKLFEIINANFDTSNIIEATLEANPNSLTEKLLSYLKSKCITRISLGVQSLHDNELKILGRLHDSKCAVKAMETVKNYDYDLNADLIFSIPDSNLRKFNESLNIVMNYADHISAYQLTLEPGTKLYNKYSNKDFNKDGYKYYRYIQYKLPKKGYTQYEISNFAKSGKECIHNLCYWNNDDFLALGFGASGCINRARYKILTNGRLDIERLSENDIPKESAILLLRTSKGINKNTFIKSYGEKALSYIESRLSNIPDELIIRNTENISLTAKGMRVGNAIWLEII